MKYELFDFQKNAVNDLLKKMVSMQKTYAEDGSLSAISLTAPTGAGKTVISAAVAEGLFYGNDEFEGDNNAVILWLSDSPSLNDQTMKRFNDATDLLNGATDMVTIGNDFAKNHSILEPKKVYFLNRQLLGKGKKLSNEPEGGRSFFDVLNNTIDDEDIHLYLFIDEAHRGLGKGNDKGTSDSANKTIYSIIIDGQEGINKPMPCVVGISATPERFDNAMKGRKDRDIKAGIKVSNSDVKESGLIKDIIEVRTPKEAADTKHQDLKQACVKLANASGQWKSYCRDNDLSMVIPLMVVQVEDNVSNESLTLLCNQILHVLPWLDPKDCFANVFGEHENIITSRCDIPYVKPDEVTEKTNIRVLFAKDAVSTGWDCPRAEVIYSRRKRTDPTYIAQLIGRMIRTPLARRVDTVMELNTVFCYLPEFDANTVDMVVERLREDNVPVEPDKVIKNPVDVRLFGQVKENLERKRVSIQTSGSEHPVNEKEPNNDFEDDFPIVIDDFPTNIDDDIVWTEDEVNDAIDRVPIVDFQDIKESFESIITRKVRKNNHNYFLDLVDFVDIINEDLDPEAKIGHSVEEEFYYNIEGEIQKHLNEFNSALDEIKNTTVLVNRVDPLTGNIFEGREESVENDSDRLFSYYKHAKTKFAGASDYLNYYIDKCMQNNCDSKKDAITRIAAVANCTEIVQAMEQWAENKANNLLDKYSSMRYAVKEDNKEKWDHIEGNTKPYIERNLNINSVSLRQDEKDDKYQKHIICDDYGWCYLKLNDLEKKVVEIEFNYPNTVAFYRNDPYNRNASLSIPYELNGELKNNYPDFIFFVETGEGIAPAIVDPHGDWLADSVAKLKGYVEYINDYPNMFVKVLIVADEKKGKIYYLDLMKESVRKAIEDFDGSSAKELFTGSLGREYS